MQFLDTDHIDFWPKGVLLGSAEISSQLSEDILEEEELREYNGFMNPGRKAEYLTARHLFRYMMQESDMDTSLTLFKHEHGKPYLWIEGKDAFVSFSHSSSRVFCAVSEQLDLGIDAEHSGRSINSRVLSRILSEKEQGYLLKENPVQLWTIKEAAVKCLGTGLRTNLNEVIIQKDKKNRFSVRFNNEYLFEICSFTQLNHQIALAYQSQ